SWRLRLRAVSRGGPPVLMARRVDKVWKVRTISTVSIVVGMKGDSRRKACNGPLRGQMLVNGACQRVTVDRRGERSRTGRLRVTRFAWRPFLGRGGPHVSYEPIRWAQQTKGGRRHRRLQWLRQSVGAAGCGEGSPGFTRRQAATRAVARRC